MRLGMRLITAALALLAGLGFAMAADERPKTAFDHEFTAIDGGKLDLAQYRGKVLLVVNTASFCGFTKQYEGLQALWEKYEGKGLVVLGVPSNDFGGQEPKAEGEIKEFCQGAFGITFPLSAKYEVSGANAHPFYKWTVGVLGAAGAPRWNFHKILVGRDGKPVAAYGATTTPSASALVSAIERELAKP